MSNGRYFFSRVRFLFMCAVVAGGALGLSSFFSAPADFLTELQTKYERYIQKYPVVKLHIVFNQPAYSPGDTLYFKAWYQTEARSAVSGTHIITLDIVSGEGKTVQKTRFKVKDGSGSNQIILDENLGAGLYKIVGYSDWMKNFGESWYYMTDLLVTKSKSVSVERKIPDNKIRFFVEGGKAIAGVQNNFVGLGPAGRHAVVVDKSHTTVTEIDFDSTGVSRFKFTPELENTYLVNWAGQVCTLPPVEADGVALLLQANSSTVQLTLPANSKLSGDDLYAVVLQAGKITLKQNFVISSPATFELSLPKSTDGLGQLFVFNKKGDVLASRFYSSVESKKPNVNILFPEKLFQRSEGTGAISISDRDGNALEADVTVSVFQKDLFAESSSSSGFHQSGLPEVDQYVNGHPGKSAAQLNDFLITQRAGRINWEYILSGKDPELKYSFSSQFGLKGKVVAKPGFSEIPDSTTVIAYLQQNTIGYEGYTKDGKFTIPFVLDFFGKDQVFFTLQNKTRILDENYDIVVQDDSVNLSARWESRELAASSPYGNYAMKRGIVARSYSFFENSKGKSKQDIENPNRFFEDEFLGADFTVNVSEYVIFPTMIELVREVVPFVQHRKRKSGDELRLSYRRENTTHVFQSDPLYIMDGAMTRNTAFFLTLKPEDLLYFKLINNPNKLSQLGRLGENGIVFIESKKGDLASKITTKNYFQATGISRVIPFQTKSDGRENMKSPDLRSTLYWNPNLKSTQSGPTNLSFSTGDDIGPMKIVVRGFTKEGIPFSAEKEFMVTVKNRVE